MYSGHQRERQLVTRSSSQRLRCCVCHLHHEQAMKAPYRVRQFFAKVLKNVQHYRVDVIAGDVNAAAYKYYKKQITKFCTTPRLWSCLEKCNVRSTWTAHLRADFILIIRPIIIILSLSQQIILIGLHGYSLMRKTAWTHIYKKTLKQHA